MIWDSYGRPILNMRISVTLRCNFRCIFCHREGIQENNYVDEMTPYEIGLLAEAAKKVGIRSIKLTGGEPLLRMDLDKILEEIRRWYPEAELSVVTNGFFLDKYIEVFINYKVDHVNVSLHTLNKTRFEAITGVDGLKRVLNNIIKAVDAGLNIRINTVILRTLNLDELPAITDLASKLGVRLRFIELEYVGVPRDVFEREYAPVSTVIEKLKHRIVKIRYRYGLHNRPVIILDNGLEIELVGAAGNPAFCARCTRIRVTPDGSFIPCLHRGDERVKFIDYVRETKSREEAVNVVIKALLAVNRLRRPFYMYKVSSRDIVHHGTKVYRLAHFRREGTAVIPGSSEEVILRDWL